MSTTYEAGFSAGESQSFADRASRGRVLTPRPWWCVDREAVRGWVDGYTPRRAAWDSRTASRAQQLIGEIA
jgi:hypothetical protein